MLLTFDVGVTERHHVTFSFNKFWGNLSIKVDDVSVVRTVRIASIGLVKRFEFLVGAEEQHHVRIESGCSPGSAHNRSTPTSTTNS